MTTWHINLDSLTHVIREIYPDPEFVTARKRPLLEAFVRSLADGDEYVRDINVRIQVKKALKALQETGGSHFLNNTDRRMAALTLMALERILEMAPLEAKGDQWKLTTTSLKALALSDEAWKIFLEQISLPPSFEDSDHVRGLQFYTGFHEKAREVKLVFGSLIYWEKVLGDSLDLVDTIQWAVCEIERHVNGQVNFYPRSRIGLNKLKESYIYLKARLDEYERDKKAGDPLQADTSLFQDVISEPATARHLKRLLVHLGRHGADFIRKTRASVALTYTATGSSARLLAPLGVPTPYFPKVDGRNREEVLAFLIEFLPRNLMQTMGEDPEAAAARLWQIWEGVWNNQGIGADDLLHDLDDAVWRDVGLVSSRFSRETVYFYSQLIALMALVIRDQKPIAAATHSSAGRVADMCNSPEAAAVKLVLFLLGKNDRKVTPEMVRRSPFTFPFEKLADHEKQILQQLLEPLKIPHDKLADPEEGFVAQVQKLLQRDETLTEEARRILYRAIGIYVKGSKGAVPLKNRILIDDKAFNVEEFVSAGGMGGIVLGKHRYQVDPVALLEIAAEVKRLYLQDGKPVIVDLRNSSLERPAENAGQINLAHEASTLTSTYFISTTPLVLGRIKLLWRDWKRWVRADKEPYRKADGARRFRVSLQDDAYKLEEVFDNSFRFDPAHRPYVISALWDQAFREGQTSPEFFSAKDYKIIESFIGKERKKLIQFMDHTDFKPALDHLWNGLRDKVEDEGKLARSLRRLALGEDSPLSRIMDGLMVTSFLKLDGRMLEFMFGVGGNEVALNPDDFLGTEVMDIEYIFLPLWYILHRAADASHAGKLRRYFEAAIQALKKMHQDILGHKPIIPIPWKIMKDLPPERARQALVQVMGSRGLRLDDVPESFPMVRLEERNSQSRSGKPLSPRAKRQLEAARRILGFALAEMASPTGTVEEGQAVVDSRGSGEGLAKKDGTRALLSPEKTKAGQRPVRFLNHPRVTGLTVGGSSGFHFSVPSPSLAFNHASGKPLGLKASKVLSPIQPGFSSGSLLPLGASLLGGAKVIVL